MVNNIIKSKKGWVQLVEVFIAILLLAGVLFALGTRSSSDKKDFQETMSKKETAILRDIELNSQLRTEVLSVSSGSLPLEWNNFGSSGLTNVRDRIAYLTPKNMNCEARICPTSDICTYTGATGKEIYAESVFIGADLETYSPRQLKLFCMEK